MKLEEALNRVRLPAEQEEAVPELDKVYENPESFGTEELVDALEASSRQSGKLEQEYNAHLRHSTTIDSSYQNSDYQEHVQLTKFKKSRSEVKKVLDENADAADSLGIKNASDALESKLVRGSDEVERYKSERANLRRLVKKLSDTKKKIRETTRFDDVKDLSFRSEKRKESISALHIKSGEISGSIDILRNEAKKIKDELLKRAEKAWKIKLVDIQDKFKELDKGSVLSFEEFRKKSITIVNRALVEIAVEFGIEIADEIRDRLDEYSIDKNEFQNYLRSGLLESEDLDFKKLTDKENALVETVGYLDKKELETDLQFKSEYGKSIDDVPVNIQYITPEGYQGLSASEGKVVVYAFLYEGKEEYLRMRNDLTNLSEQVNLLSNQARELEGGLRTEKLNNPAGFLNFKLKKLYKDKQDGIDLLKKRINEKKEKIDDLEKEVERLHNEVKTIKIPLDVVPEGKVEFNLEKHSYVHENYGRGYAGARERDPMKTVRDYFNLFRKDCYTRIDKLKQEQKKYAEDHDFELYDKLDKRKRNIVYKSE